MHVNAHETWCANRGASHILMPTRMQNVLACRPEINQHDSTILRRIVF
jgi:hypothetical protein